MPLKETTRIEKATSKAKEIWRQKPLNCQFIRRRKNADVDQFASHNWLMISGLKGKTEGFILSAQDQRRHTRNYQAYILHNSTDQNAVTNTLKHILKKTDTLLKYCLMFLSNVLFLFS